VRLVDPRRLGRRFGQRHAAGASGFARGACAQRLRRTRAGAAHAQCRTERGLADGRSKRRRLLTCTR
jgi:hypothetical protein